MPPAGIFLKRGRPLHKSADSREIVENIQGKVEGTSFFLFARSVPTGTPKLRPKWSLPLPLSLKFIEGHSVVQPRYRGPRYRSASPLLYLLRIHPSKAKDLHLYLFQRGHPGIHIERVPKIPFLRHLLHEGVFALLILCSIHCTLICLVRSTTSILQYVSCPAYL